MAPKIGSQRHRINGTSEGTSKGRPRSQLLVPKCGAMPTADAHSRPQTKQNKQVGRLFFALVDFSVLVSFSFFRGLLTREREGRQGVEAGGGGRRAQLCATTREAKTGNNNRVFLLALYTTSQLVRIDFPEHKHNGFPRRGLLGGTGGWGPSMGGAGEVRGAGAWVMPHLIVLWKMSPLWGERGGRVPGCAHWDSLARLHRHLVPRPTPFQRA
jgi:hypothetical protein